MNATKRRLGCGFWLLWLFLAIVAGEWLLLSHVLRSLPSERVAQPALVILATTNILGGLAVFLRVQRRPS